MELILFSGLQASGKTTFYQKFFSKTHLHLSKDLWPHAKKPQSRLIRLVEQALQEKRSVVVDNTNPTPSDRESLIAIGKKYDAYIIGYFFISTVAESQIRNQQRTGKQKVPDVALFSTIKKLILPQYQEGFHEIFHVSLYQGDFQINLLPNSREGSSKVP